MSTFLNALKQSGFLDRIHLSICNVGSRKVSAQDDYASQVWRIFAPNLTIYGFDADPEACDAANQEFEARAADWNEFHIPIAISKESGSAKLFVTKNPMCSSLYRPNEELLQHFPGLPNLVNLNHITEIETTTLDTFCQAESINDIAFLQIDVQGAELQVLEGAVQILDQSVLAIQAEVEFSALYENQPLFADVDRFLRQQGFTLFDLSKSQLARSPIWSLNRPGQLLWGDAVYLRDPFAQDTPEQFKTSEQMFKLACVADALQFTDFALELLKDLTLKYGKDPKYNFANIILDILNQMPGLEQSPRATALITELETWLTIHC